MRENPNHLRIISEQAELTAKKIDRPLLFSDLPSFANILLLQGPVGPFFSNLRYFYKNNKTHSQQQPQELTFENKTLLIFYKLQLLFFLCFVMQC